MKIFAAVTAFAAAATLMAGTAQANDFMFKPYFGVEVSKININFDELRTTNSGVMVDPAQVFEKSYTAWSPYIGIDLHKHIALEAGYMGSEIGQKQLAGDDRSKAEFKGTFADLVLKFPVSGNVNLLGSVGLARIQTDVTAYLPSVSLAISGRSKETALRYGLGADMRVHKNISLRANVRYTDADLGGMANEYLQYGASLVFRF